MKKNNAFLISIAFMTLIEAICWFIQRRLVYNFAPIEFKDVSKPTFIKYAIEYLVLKNIFFVIVWIISAKKTPRFNSTKSVLLHNTLFFIFCCIFSLILYPMSLLQYGNFNFSDIIYLKIFNLLISLLVGVVSVIIFNRLAIEYVSES